MRLLFVKPQRIGDALVLTPTLRAVKQAYPEAEICVLVRRGSEGILAGCPEIARILTMASPDDRKINLRSVRDGIVDLWRLRQEQFDFVIELSDSHRGRLFAALTRAEKRTTLKTFSPLNAWEKQRFAAQSTFEWETRHRVERDYFSTREFLPKMAAEPPPLVFDRDRTQTWPEGGPLTRFCVMQIGTWKAYGRWPHDRWREVARYLFKHFEQIVISSGNAPHEIEDALWLQRELGPGVVCTLGRTTWPQVAGLLYRAGLYVGLDTAAMHLAAACGCPIVGKFATTEDRWYPWQANFRAVLPEAYRDIADPVLRRQLRREPKAEDVMPSQMIEACEEMLLAR